MEPYVGVTGFTRLEEVKAVLDVFPSGNRKLTVGVLVTYKSLRGIPMKPRWAKQTPSPGRIRKIFLNDERVINLVHFSTEEGQGETILADLLKIHHLAGQISTAFNSIWFGQKFNCQ